VRFDNKRIVEVPEYRVRFAVGGPGAFHHVSVHVLGVAEDEDGELPTPPEQRTTMSSADDPIDWTFELPDFDAAVDAWAVVTWIRPHLEGVASEAVARWLNRDRLYQWRWYRPRSQATRIRLRNWARRHPQMSWEKLRDLSVYGEWERKAPSNPLGLEGPIGKPPPA
jgi:hypothetical protein